MINKHISLYDFGYNFLGPICSEYFYVLAQRSKELESGKLLFLAREGYFFSKVYQELVNKKLIEPLPNTYFYASRTFLFKISIGDPYTWKLSLSHTFYGSLEQLLIARFGFSLFDIEQVFSRSELNVKWQLPFEQDQLELLLAQKVKLLKVLVQQSRTAYIDYMRSEGVFDSKLPLVVDVGYSGTIQKLLTRLIHSDTYGLYFIVTHAGEHQIGDYKSVMESVYKQGVKMGDGYTMLDRSLFLESLLTSPNGQFIDISKNSDGPETSFNFFFGRKANTQGSIHALNVVFDGAKDAIIHAFENNIRYTTKEIESMYELYTYNKFMFPQAIWPLFDVDDAISGNANVNPLVIFRL